MPFFGDPVGTDDTDVHHGASFGVEGCAKPSCCVVGREDVNGIDGIVFGEVLSSAVVDLAVWVADLPEGGLVPGVIFVLDDRR